MLHKLLACALLAALAACANAPERAAQPKPSAETVDTGGESAAAVVNIPVDDPRTKSVSATLFKPSGKGPFPAVIILCGCAGVGPDAGIVKRLNADYLPNGIATLVVDSFTPRGIAEVCSDLQSLQDQIRYRVKDAHAALDWLSTRPEIDAKHIFLQGYSHGAITAIAAIDSRWATTHPGKFAGVIAFYPYCFSGNKFPVPTIILVGQLDDWTPAQLCQGIADKTNLEVTVYPNASHGFAAPGVDVMYLGHRLAFDEAAANDGQRRALAFIRSLRR